MPPRFSPRRKGGGPKDYCAWKWLAALAFAALATTAAAQAPCPGIHVTILDIRNSAGSVACALFESAEGFPVEFLRAATNVMVIKVRQSRARCYFENIPPGMYALAVIHDEDVDGKLGTNALGIPSEGYGFSNDAKAWLSAPSFEAARFSYDGRDLKMTIKLHY
jgi:uncharacterized protein (DUF2141 family)